MTKIVRTSLAKARRDAAQMRRLRSLATRPDSEIDLSDMPELTDEVLARGVRGKLYRPVKRQITLRLDSDVILWLRRQGKGYQTRANALLREAMLRVMGGKTLGTSHVLKDANGDRTLIGLGQFSSARRKKTRSLPT